MNASAALQLALASPKCGFKQLDMFPNVAWGTKLPNVICTLFGGPRELVLRRA
jgi:hypothetical protein